MTENAHLLDRFGDFRNLFSDHTLDANGQVLSHFLAPFQFYLSASSTPFLSLSLFLAISLLHTVPLSL